MGDSPGSVRALVRKYKADTEEQKAVVNYILEKIDKFRDVLVDAVDPQKIKIYSIEELKEISTYFEKNNIEWFIAIVFTAYRETR
jgi:hypothetical protein